MVSDETASDEAVATKPSGKRGRKKGQFFPIRGGNGRKGGLVKVRASPRHRGEEEKEMNDETTVVKSLSFLTQRGGG